MKTKSKMWLTFVLIFFFWALGAYIWTSDPHADKVPFPASILVYFLRGVLSLFENPFVIACEAISGVVGFYIYDNFIKAKVDPVKTENDNQVQDISGENNSAIVFTGGEGSLALEKKKLSAIKSRKIAVLLGIIAVFFWTFVIVIASVGAPAGSGMASFALLLPVLPFLYFVFPIYFIILSLKFHREGNAMDSLDKVVFYILFTYVIGGFLFVITKAI